MEIPESRLLDQLEAAVSATLLRESTDQVGTLHLRARADQPHPLPRTRRHPPRPAAPARRARARGRSTASDADDALADLALHWRLATCRSTGPRRPTTRSRAGRRALDSLAPSEAVKLFSDALELLGAEDTRRPVRGADRARRSAASQTGDPAPIARRCSTPRGSRQRSTTPSGPRERRWPTAAADSRAPSVRSISERVAAIERALELDRRPRPARAAAVAAARSSCSTSPTPAPPSARRAGARARAARSDRPRTTARVLERLALRVRVARIRCARRLAHLR